MKLATAAHRLINEQIFISSEPSAKGARRDSISKDVEVWKTSSHSRAISAAYSKRGRAVLAAGG